MKITFTSFKRKVTGTRNRNISILASLALMLCSLPSFAQLALLKDINTEENPLHNEYSWLTNAGKYMYFVSNNELWKSNGTTRYTTRMKIFRSVSNLTMVGATLYFMADDGTSGSELWKSNGSPGSTIRVKDIVPGSRGSSPAQFTYVNGTVYFTAWFPGKGIELWKTNGTAAGTVMVKDISTGSANPKYLTSFNRKLFFSASGSNGNELWKSDGTPANTVLVKDIYVGAKSSNPKFLTVSSNILFFSAFHPNRGTEIWKSDGTRGGTRLLRDIRVGTGSSGPENLIHANGKLMFTANNGIHGDELWASNGLPSGTVLVKDMNPGGAGSNHSGGSPMGHFTNIKGLLYFVASKGTQDYFYRSDGTNAGTIIIVEAERTEISGDAITTIEVQPEFTYRNGYVYFFNQDGQYPPYSLYRMPYNGTAISLIRSFGIPQDYFSLRWRFNTVNRITLEMIHMNGALYFPARLAAPEDESAGFELVRSDGTYDGTVSVHDTFRPTTHGNPWEMIVHNKRVYMLTYGFLSVTPGLYSTDGTPEGTFELRPDRYHYEWEPVGNDLYIVEEGASDLESIWQLTKTRGTPETTHVITNGTNWDQTTQPAGLKDVNGTLYYFNALGEVWKSNGTAAGTVRVRKFYTVRSITEVNGQAFILVGNENNSIELWKTTSSGLVLLRTFPNTTWCRFGVKHTTVIKGIFYFLACQANRPQVFRSNGTTQGSYRMFGPEGFQEESQFPSEEDLIFMEYNEKLYFSNGNALFSVTGNAYSKVSDMPRVRRSVELNGKLLLFTAERDLKVYVTDGSPEGTQILVEKPESPTWVDYATVGDYVYFSTLWHPELWRTDGSACGTTVVNVGTEGAFSLAVLGDDLIFGGYRLATGIEPYIYHNINSIPGPVCEDETLLSAGEENKIQEEILNLFYPNPFTESFTMKVKGNDGDKVQVAIYTGGGTPVETFENIEVNTEHSNIGAAWQKGFYIVKVRTGDKIETYHVIKK